jgi:hypothetical protein
MTLVRFGCALVALVTCALLVGSLFDAPRRAPKESLGAAPVQAVTDETSLAAGAAEPGGSRDAALREPEPPATAGREAPSNAPASSPAPVHPYLVGLTPSEVLPDGTQVYHGIQSTIVQPDGTEVVVATTVKLKPIPPVQVLDSSSEPR